MVQPTCDYVLVCMPWDLSTEHIRKLLAGSCIKIGHEGITHPSATQGCCRTAIKWSTMHEHPSQCWDKPLLVVQLQGKPPDLEVRRLLL